MSDYEDLMRMRARHAEEAAQDTPRARRLAAEVERLKAGISELAGSWDSRAEAGATAFEAHGDYGARREADAYESCAAALRKLVNP